MRTGATLRSGARVLGVALAFVAPAARAQAPIEVQPTALLRGPVGRAAAVVELRLSRALDAPYRVQIQAPGGAIEAGPRRNAAGERWYVQLPSAVAGDPQPCVAQVEEGGEPGVRRSWTVRFRVPPADRGWVVHLIPGFHFDPVWWNTQANYTETGARLGSDVGSGHDLVDAYLDLAARDPDTRVTLHQLPYLKTYLEARPWRREALRRQIDAGRVALAGGTYNELSSTLVGAEAIVRNAVYGALYQREVLGGDGRVFWQCDVFGHDPSFPSLAARAGLRAGAFARGPFHQWGAPREQVNFPSEFLWMAPDGGTVLAHYMTGHYGYAYGSLAALPRLVPDAAPAEVEAAHARWEEALGRMFEDLRRPALTHHVLLPMHSDFARPVEHLGDIVRHWNATYLSPRVEISSPEAFFAAVRREIELREIAVPALSRDMNPIYTGCPVSFADLKLAERECENRLREAEIWATVASLEGAPYPAASVDRAWRQLLFAAHHDAVTGSMSDQVYVDMLYVYRDALDLALRVRDGALAYLTGRLPPGPAVRWSTTADPLDPASAVVRCAPEGAASPPPEVDDHPRFVRLSHAGLAVEIDLERGGTITSLVHEGRNLLRGPGNDIVLLPEHENLPGHGEGPWHLAPTGERRPGSNVRARLQERDPEHPHRVTLEADYPEFTKRQTYELGPETTGLEMTTEIVDWCGRNALLRAEFPFELPGTRPLHETAAAVVARPFARDVATARDPWTLDQACGRWAALAVTCAVLVVRGPQVVHRRVLGVGEIVVADDAGKRDIERANEVVAAFARCGVTTCITRAGGRRYGDLAYDSNVPDFRVALGSPALLLDPAKVASWARREAASWVEPGDSLALPVLVLPSEPARRSALGELESSHVVRVAEHHAAVTRPASPTPQAVALLNRGVVSVHTSNDGTLGLNLMRSSTGWPAGVWIDRPARRLPDGAPFETMHGTHRFEYALVPFTGDWRSARIPMQAMAYQERGVRTAGRTGQSSGSRLPGTGRFVEIDPPGVLLLALKPAGFPAARQRPAVGREREALRAVAVRLWNSTGAPAQARLRLHRFTGRARRTNLLEEHVGPLPVRDGWVVVDLEPFAVETVVCEVKSEPSPGSDPYATLAGATGEDPSAPWLENRGEGVTHNGLVTLAPEQRSVRPVAGAAGVRIHVANHHATRPVTLDFAVEHGPHVSAHFEHERLTVDPRQSIPVLLLVSKPKREPVPSVVVVRARRLGASVSAAVWIEPESDETPPAPFAVLQQDRVVGEKGVLRATIENRTEDPIEGEATWLAPLALWERMPAWRQIVRLAPRGKATVVCPLDGGLDSWALLRFTAAGRVAYGEPIAVVRDPGRVLLRPLVDRVRIRRGEPATLPLEATSLAGLDARSTFTVTAPRGWKVRETERRFVGGSLEKRLDATLEVEPPADAADAELEIRPRKGRAARVAASLVPVQHARRRLGEVRIDGRQDEWRAEEFTEAASALGRARAAVRWGDDGIAVAIAVLDETFSQPHTGPGIWQGDSVQLGLTVAPAQSIGYDAGVLEFGAAQAPEGPLVWCWYGGEAGRTGRVDGAALAVGRHAGWTLYEIRLPRAVLAPLALTPGAVLGFTYIANDDDGQGFQGAVQWTRGMSGGKDASLFGDLVLEGE